MELKIYEIPSQIQAALNAIEVDEETGEIVGWDKVEALTESATTKIANCARFLQYAQVQIVDPLTDKVRRLSDLSLNNKHILFFKGLDSV